MISNRSDLKRYVAADLGSLGLDGWRPQYRLTQRIAFWTWLLRRTEYWTNCRRDPIGRLVRLVLLFRLRRLGERMGIDIPLNCFGPGLSIAHPGTIVIHMQCKVGSDCRIHQGVTLGSVRNGVPTLGDRVHIGANATILGDITVGDDAKIGAGSVVVHDVPDGVTVVGVPAKPVRSSEPAHART
jgi:serine O-acetyltransferase